MIILIKKTTTQSDNLFQMKPAPEWQASYQTMGSLRFPFYHKLSFSSLQIYLFQRQKYLFFFILANIFSISWFLFHQFNFFVFIGANISTISCFLFIIENLYYITSMNFSFNKIMTIRYLAISFFPKPARKLFAFQYPFNCSTPILKS